MFIEANKANKKDIFTSGIDQENYVYTPISARENTSLIWRFFLQLLTTITQMPSVTSVIPG